MAGGASVSFFLFLLVLSCSVLFSQAWDQRWGNLRFLQGMMISYPIFGTSVANSRQYPSGQQEDFEQLATLKDLEQTR